MSEYSSSQQGHEDVHSMICWLKTFPEFDCKCDQSLDSATLLNQIDVAKAVLCVTALVSGKAREQQEATNREDDAEKVWGLIFSCLNGPKVMQLIAGRRVSSLELKHILLSSLVCACVSPTCTQRIEYINRIMALPNHIQHTLMKIIETYPKTPLKSPACPRTPVRSMSLSRKITQGRLTPPSRPLTPSRSISARLSSQKTPLLSPAVSYNKSHLGEQEQSASYTPRSSASHKSLNYSFKNEEDRTPASLQATPTNLLSSTPSSRYQSRRAPSHANKECNDINLVVLLAWIRTFPELSTTAGVTVNIPTLNDPKVAFAILEVAKELCDDSTAKPDASNAEKIWTAFSMLVARRIAPSLSPDFRMSPTLSTIERQTKLLSILLAYAVSDQCTKRNLYIGRILTLSADMQQQLMRIAHDEASFRSSVRKNITTPTKSRLNSSGNEDATLDSFHLRRSLDDMIASPSGFTPAKKRHSSYSQGKMSGKKSDTPMCLDLLKELERSTEREAELNLELQNVESKLRKEMMKIETDAKQRTEEIEASYRLEISKLQSELNSSRDILAREQKAQAELAKTRDELDLLQHAKEKLADAEEKLCKYRERVEQLADVKESLKREEEAHSASVEQCIRLDNDLKALQPLRRQLEEYKNRAVEAEIELAECQDDLKRTNQVRENLDRNQQDLIQEARSYQEEAESLRNILSEGNSDDCEGPAVGEGLSEMNPQIKEELLRLRNENSRLAEFASKRETDEVQRLEENMEDSQRLCDRFKEQFLTTKKELESSRNDLAQSKDREDGLKEEVIEWSGKYSKLEKVKGELEDELEMTISDLETTGNNLEQVRNEKERLNNELSTNIKRYEELNNTKQELENNLQVTRLELEGTNQLLEDSKNREEVLSKDLSDVSDKRDSLQEELQLSRETCHQKQAELDETLELSKNEVTSLKKQLEEMDQKIEEGTQKTCSLIRELNTTVEELHQTKKILQTSLSTEKGLKEALHGMTESKKKLDDELIKEKEMRANDSVVAKDEMTRIKETIEKQGQDDLRRMQENMNQLLEDERLSGRNRLEAAHEEHRNSEEKLSSAYKELELKMKSALETTKTDYETKIKHLNQKYQEEIVNTESHAESDREILIKKGKGMLKESKEKAREIMRKLEDELEESKNKLAHLENERYDFGQKVRTKMSTYKQKLKFSSSRIAEITQDNDQLKDNIRAVEREKIKVLEENERFRRQLGGRYGADGTAQNQMEMLQKEFNAVLEENRALKKKLSMPATMQSLGSISEVDEAVSSGNKPYASGGVSGSTLSALREEYEEQIQSLNDEKRELVMRNSAAITDVQKAEQRAWELEKELENMKHEVTSAHLAVQRMECKMEDQLESSGYEQPYSVCAHPDNETKKENLTTSSLLMDLDMSSKLPSPSKVLSPSNRANIKISSASSSSAVKDHGYSNDSKGKVGESSEFPTLMEMTQHNSGETMEAKQECKQS